MAKRIAAGFAVVAALVLAAPGAAAEIGGPRCPENAPAGAEFVRTVQPPFGLAYDEYRMPDGRLVSVYC